MRSHRFKHPQQNTRDRREKISGAEDTIENIVTIVKENAKGKKFLTQNIQDIQTLDLIVRISDLRIIGVEDNKDFPN